MIKRTSKTGSRNLIGIAVTSVNNRSVTRNAMFKQFISYIGRLQIQKRSSTLKQKIINISKCCRKLKLLNEIYRRQTYSSIQHNARSRVTLNYSCYGDTISFRNN